LTALTCPGRNAPIVTLIHRVPRGVCRVPGGAARAEARGRD
jgi:hypothetical protein